MEQQRKDQNEEFNTNKNQAGKGAADSELGKEQKPKETKNKSTSENPDSHDEGQYPKNSDKPTMSPGSSEAEVNPSAKDHLKDNS